MHIAISPYVCTERDRAIHINIYIKISILVSLSFSLVHATWYYYTKLCNITSDHSSVLIPFFNYIIMKILIGNCIIIVSSPFHLYIGNARKFSKCII